MKNIGIKETLERLNTEFEGRDDFLSKDVLTTANQLNASRGLMFSSHLEQYVVLDKPDFPYVFTNYENEVGSYSSSFFKSNNNKEVVAKISKYENNDNVYILVTKDEDGVYDIIERKVGEELTENYAYLYKNDVIDNKTVGSKISKDEILYRSTSFDDDMNFMYGINANVCYMIEDRTIEDAIVCSESFSERMTSNYITEFSITLNNNDILCNLYGDKDNYKAFPDIGERNNSRVFVSMRRINYDSALFDLQDDNLRSINYNNDTKFYAEGELIDIEIRSNRSDLVLAKSKFNSQVVKYLHIERDYYRNIHEVLGEIISNPDNKFTNDLSFLYRKADDYLTIYNEVQKEDKNEKSVRWQNEKSEFDNFIITFKLLQKDKLKSGSKICNRFGSKGVISKILPDDQMPVAENGRRADVILNALGIVNRLKEC